MSVSNSHAATARIESPNFAYTEYFNFFVTAEYNTLFLFTNASPFFAVLHIIFCTDNMTLEFTKRCQMQDLFCMSMQKEEPNAVSLSYFFNSITSNSLYEILQVCFIKIVTLDIGVTSEFTNMTEALKENSCYKCMIIWKAIVDKIIKIATLTTNFK